MSLCSLLSAGTAQPGPPPPPPQTSPPTSLANASTGAPPPGAPPPPGVHPPPGAPIGAPPPGWQPPPAPNVAAPQMYQPQQQAFSGQQPSIGMAPGSFGSQPIGSQFGALPVGMTVPQGAPQPAWGQPGQGWTHSA